MASELSDRDYRQDWHTVRLLRLALHSIRTGNGGVGFSQQEIANYAALWLQSIVLEEKVPPACLISLISELLDDRETLPSAPPHRQLPKDDQGTDARIVEPCSAADLVELRAKHIALLELIAGRFRGTNVVGSKGFEMAAAFEASHPEGPDGEPSTASVSAVARKSGKSRDTIRRWRKSHSYRSMVKRLRAG